MIGIEAIWWEMWKTSPETLPGTYEGDPREDSQ